MKLILTLTFALILSTVFAQKLEAQVDWPAPPFELADDGGRVFHYPKDLEGPTIILFWATWCPYCKALMPHLQSIVDEYEGEIQVLALDIRDDEDPAEYLARYGYDFRLFPESDPVAEQWSVKGTPGLFLVDAAGDVLFSNFTIPEDAYRADVRDEGKSLKHFQKASRKAPFWAAQLRLAIDKTRGNSEN